MTGELTALQFQRQDVSEHWRVLGWGAAAWYGVPSYAAGATFARRVLHAIGDAGRIPDLDLRGDGVRVRIRPQQGVGSLTTDDAETARLVSAAADELGLGAEPERLDELLMTFDALDAGRVLPFWSEVLGYRRLGGEDLVDPEWREPSVWFQEQDAPRPLRNRIHVDVVRDLDSAARVDLLDRTGSQEFSGPFGVMLADAEGNEVDVVPSGSDWDGRPDVSDWRLLFSAVACYPTASASEAADLVEAVAGIADESGNELLIDVRPGSVTLDSGKDRWEYVDGFEDLARRAQQSARALGLTAAPGRPRFVQLGFDAVDVEAVRTFWREALRYVDDPRPGLTDLYDPRRLGPTLIFQPMSAEEEERCAQRNRIHVDLFVPQDQAEARVDAALAAGGRVVYDGRAPHWWTIADPEGNELDIAVRVGREEASAGAGPA